MEDVELQFVHGGEILFLFFLKTWEKGPLGLRSIALIIMGTIRLKIVDGQPMMSK